MIKDFQNIINAACDRFNNEISQLDIVTWLENFEKADWKKALIVLNNFEYYSTKDIIREFDNGLKTIINGLKPKEKIFLVPVGKIGKSGMAMIYYLKKTPSFGNPNVFLVDSDNNENNKVVDFSNLTELSKVILVDDFSGTGGTILDFYKEINLKLPKNHSIIALTIAFLDIAKDTLAKENIQIVGNQRLSAFSPRGSVFGYFPKMEAIREFCFEYGNKLYPIDRFKDGKTKQHPLGFLNTQALIGFAHSIPNNTLPILWADVKRKDIDKKWNPLFPRRGDLIIERSKEFKQNQLYWTSIIYKLGIDESIFPSGVKYDKQTIQLISMIYLKRKQKNILNICQLLGLNYDEYDLIIKEGQAKSLFDNNEELTEQAINIFEQIKKKVKFQKNSFDNSELTIQEDMLYVPKTFRGGS